MPAFLIPRLYLFPEEEGSVVVETQRSDGLFLNSSSWSLLPLSAVRGCLPQTVRARAVLDSEQGWSLMWILIFIVTIVPGAPACTHDARSPRSPVPRPFPGFMDSMLAARGQAGADLVRGASPETGLPSSRVQMGREAFQHGAGLGPLWPSVQRRAVVRRQSHRDARSPQRKSSPGGPHPSLSWWVVVGLVTFCSIPSLWARAWALV